MKASTQKQMADEDTSEISLSVVRLVVYMSSTAIRVSIELNRANLFEPLHISLRICTEYISD